MSSPDQEDLEATGDITQFTVTSTNPDAQATWRDVQIFSPKEFEELKQYIQDYLPTIVPHANILLLGPIGVGKSSFINSVASVLADRIVTLRYTQDNSNASVTVKYDYAQMDMTAEEQFNFRLYDSMGLEEDMQGLSVEQSKAMIDGKIPIGTKLSTDGSDKTEFLEEPQIEHMIHLVLIVMSTHAVQTSLNMHLKKLKAIVGYAKNQDVHCAALLTQVDQTDPAISEDIQQMFVNDEVCGLVETLSGQLQLARDDVLPIINYSTHGKMEEKRSTNILYCLKRALNLCDMTIRARREELTEAVREKQRHDREKRTGETPLGDCWRNSFQEDMNELMRKVASYAPYQAHVKHIFVLELGQIGVGKSSFVNSFGSVLEGRNKKVATVKKSDETVTKEMMNYPFKYEGKRVKMRIRDVMGLEASGKGLDPDYMRPLAAGKITTDGTEFSSKKALQLKHEDTGKPTIHQRPHVVALFVDSRSTETSERIWEHLLKAVEIAEENEIGLCVVLTKIDELDPKIKEDIRYADKSRELQQAVEFVADKLQINQSDIYCIKNYTDEQAMDDDKSKLILRVAKRFEELADDMLERHIGVSTEESEEDRKDELEELGESMLHTDSASSTGEFPASASQCQPRRLTEPQLPDTTSLPGYMQREVEQSKLPPPQVPHFARGLDAPQENRCDYRRHDDRGYHDQRKDRQGYGRGYEDSKKDRRDYDQGYEDPKKDRRDYNRGYEDPTKDRRDYDDGKKDPKDYNRGYDEKKDRRDYEDGRKDRRDYDDGRKDPRGYDRGYNGKKDRQDYDDGRKDPRGYDRGYDEKKYRRDYDRGYEDPTKDRRDYDDGKKDPTKDRRDYDDGKKDPKDYDRGYDRKKDRRDYDQDYNDGKKDRRYYDQGYEDPKKDRRDYDQGHDERDGRKQYRYDDKGRKGEDYRKSTKDRPERRNKSPRDEYEEHSDYEDERPKTRGERRSVYKSRDRPRDGDYDYEENRRGPRDREK